LDESVSFSDSPTTAGNRTVTGIPEWLETDHPREVIEAAVAHVDRNRVAIKGILWVMRTTVAVEGFAGTVREVDHRLSAVNTKVPQNIRARKLQG